MLGIRPIFHVLLIRMRRASFPVVLSLLSISLCTLSGPGDFLNLRERSAFSSSPIVISLENMSGVGPKVLSSARKSFLRFLSKSVFLELLVAEANYLLRCSAFFSSVAMTSVSLSAKGFGFSFLCVPERLCSRSQASLPPL